jgi:hypothetical protein
MELRAIVPLILKGSEIITSGIARGGSTPPEDRIE